MKTSVAVWTGWLLGICAMGARAGEPARMTADEITEGLDAETLKTVCRRPIGFNVTPDLVDFFNEWAWDRDFAKMAARDADSILAIQRGRIIAQLGQPEPAPRAAERPSRRRSVRTEAGSRPARPGTRERPSRERRQRLEGSAGAPLPEAIASKVEFVSLSERAEPAALSRLAAAYRIQGKKTVAAPTGEMLLRDTPAQRAERARNADLFILQAERWISKDESGDFGDCIPRIHGLIEEIRKANPKCLAGIEIGRRADRGGGTARLFLDFLTRYEAVHPNEIDMVYLFITRQKGDDSNMGLNALRDYFAIGRPKGKRDE